MTTDTDVDEISETQTESTAVSVAAAQRGIEFPDVRDEYSNLWAELTIRPERLAEVDAIVARIARNADTYREVERLTGVPWFAVAIIHNLEASGNFSRHLHNGDPLTARTVHVPAGRPASGTPPFAWKDSAADALRYHRLHDVADWSVERLAYELERYNGWGYRLYHAHVKSPYLWSFGNHYTKGKYVADGTWSESAVSQQCGGMVLLKRLQEAGHAQLEATALMAPAAAPVDSGARFAEPSTLDPPDLRVTLGPGAGGDAVGLLQMLLRDLSYDVDVDLVFGPTTERAVRTVQRRHGIPVDGIVGPLTWGVLEQAGAGSVGVAGGRFFPLERGFMITSPWGWRPGGFHTGTDFGFRGGSGGRPVYAVQAGTVQYSGAASGYGGPDPAGWLVIDSARSEGGGCVEYGHIVREVARGSHVQAGQRIAHINPNGNTNGGVAPHLHLSVMPRGYDPRTKMDPIPWLGEAMSPGGAAADVDRT